MVPHSIAHLAGNTADGQYLVRSVLRNQRKRTTPAGMSLWEARNPMEWIKMRANNTLALTMHTTMQPNAGKLSALARLDDVQGKGSRLV